MVLQPVRRTAGAYHYLRGGLLPHLFTLTPSPEPPRSKLRMGRLFSVTLLCPCGHQAVNLDGALCCSDFPPPACAGSDRADLPMQRYKTISNLATMCLRRSVTGLQSRSSVLPYIGSFSARFYATTQVCTE